MAGRASAFAILGLEPGADAAAVERAYKRLIKQHHPDRAGGDAGRAAEINRAYRELRAATAKNPLELDAVDDGWRRDNGWIRLASILLVAVLVLSLASGPAARLVGRLAPQPVQLGGFDRSSAKAGGEAMDEPLASAMIAQAVGEARHIARSSDEMALASAAQECQRRFRREPGIARFDRCAAFDDAVVQLQDRDPLRDRGPFSELAVTGRQMSAATLLSDDSLAIDGRLGRIRLQVELAMAPPEPDPVADTIHAPLPEAEGTGRD
jgi:hypothetical protein